MGETSLEQFQSRLQQRLEVLVGHKATADTAAMATAAVQEELRDVEARGDHLMFADGAVIKTAAAVTDASTLRIKWGTAFYPAARYVDELGSVPLGFFEEFDLYIMPQPGLPPTLVARYGAGDGEYLTANPYLLSGEQVRASGPHFAEALDRANSLGLLPETY